MVPIVRPLTPVLGRASRGAAQAELARRAARDDPRLYLRYLELLSAGGAVAALGHTQAGLWSTCLSNVSDGAQALLISHGGLIEPGLVAALPDWAPCALGSRLQALRGCAALPRRDAFRRR